MPKKKYTAEFKTKVILTIIQGGREFNAIRADFNLNPSMMRKWKQEFLLPLAHLTQILERKWGGIARALLPAAST